MNHVNKKTKSASQAWLVSTVLTTIYGTLIHPLFVLTRGPWSILKISSSSGSVLWRVEVMLMSTKEGDMLIACL